MLLAIDPKIETIRILVLIRLERPTPKRSVVEQIILPWLAIKYSLSGPDLELAINGEKKDWYDKLPHESQAAYMAAVQATYFRKAS